MPYYFSQKKKKNTLKSYNRNGIEYANMIDQLFQQFTCTSGNKFTLCHHNRFVKLYF